MDKQEFIHSLRQQLSDIDDYTYVNDTIEYYQDYIETRMRKGESESVILNELGNPGLIAKSIKASRDEITTTERSASIDDETATATGNGIYKGIFKFLNLPGWLLKLILGASVVAMLVLAFLVLQWLFPVIVVGALGYMLYKLIKGM